MTTKLAINSLDSMWNSHMGFLFSLSFCIQLLFACDYVYVLFLFFFSQWFYYSLRVSLGVDFSVLERDLWWSFGSAWIPFIRFYAISPFNFPPAIALTFVLSCFIFCCYVLYTSSTASTKCVCVCMCVGARNEGCFSFFLPSLLRIFWLNLLFFYSLFLCIFIHVCVCVYYTLIRSALFSVVI